MCVFGVKKATILMNCIAKDLHCEKNSNVYDKLTNVKMTTSLQIEAALLTVA